MRRQNDINIILDLDMVNMTQIKGDPQKINEFSSSDYVTSLIFALPIDQKGHREGSFEVNYNEDIINVNIFKVKDKFQDPILPLVKDFNVGTPGTGIPMLPFVVFTDNRGKYPCFYAELIFPFRLAEWTDPHHESGIRMDYDYEEIAIMGPPDDKDKIIALKILNRLFSSDDYESGNKSLVYEDITVFLETYFIKKSREIILQKVNFLSSKDAYKNSVIEHFLGPVSKEHISEITQQTFPEIHHEIDLQDVVFSIVAKIKHYIEDRRWIEPFWDGKRIIKIKNKNIKLPDSPRNETKIQSTLHILFHIILSSFGVHVSRETDEGIGHLDFKFMYTTKNGVPLSVSAEFKLAHNKKLKHGLTRQLPAYLRANQSSSGMFVVMWFKDENEKFFKEPKNRMKSQMIEFIDNTTDMINQEEGLNIKSILIDASIKRSASNI
jgi:hypothetical protein